MSIDEVFNNALAAYSLHAADELGLLDHLREREQVDLRRFAEEHDLHPPALLQIVRTLRECEITTMTTTETGARAARRGRRFDDAWRNKGYFNWLMGGYAMLLTDAASLCRNVNRTGSFVQRDGAAIARAGRDYGAQFVDPTFFTITDDLHFGGAVDLGCGSAGRLVQLARRRSTARLLGIEVDHGAVRLATETAAQAQLGDRLTVRQGDVTHLVPEPDHRGIDLAFSFFLGHDFWPFEDCVQTFKSIRTAFPDVKDFLFADTYRSEDDHDADGTPIFTLGFELTHSLMGHYVPTRSEWTAIFRSSGWAQQAVHPLGIANSAIFHLTPTEST